MSAEAERRESLAALAASLKPGAFVLGLDLGTKTLGVAVASLEVALAHPLETIRRTKFTADAERLAQIAAEREAAALILGLPLNMDGTEGPRAQSTRAFARNLKPRLPLPLVFWDERLSTAAADDALEAAGVRSAKRGGVIDQAAAAAILQSALDWLRSPRL
ncbi:MAG: Holliday junction resolvase RuvX [Pseudomonadota bacterium]